METNVPSKTGVFLIIVLAGIVLGAACQSIATPATDATIVPGIVPHSTATNMVVAPSPTRRPIPTHRPTKTPLPFPSNVTTVVNGEQTDLSMATTENLRIIYKAIAVASNEVTSRGYDMGPVIVYLATNKDSFLSMYLELHEKEGFPIPKEDALQQINNGFAGEGGGGSMILYLGGESWRTSASNRYTQATHEFFHTIQYGLAGKGGYRDNTKPGPIWLLEGSASYFASDIACKYGLTGNWYGWDWNAAAEMYPDVTLSETIERGYSDQSPYVVGIAATAKLVSDFGEDKIYEYFALNQKMEWQDAFQQAFGMSVDEFYQQFEAQRADLKKIPHAVCNSK